MPIASGVAGVPGVKRDTGTSDFYRNKPPGWSSNGGLVLDGGGWRRSPSYNQGGGQASGSGAGGLGGNAVQGGGGMVTNNTTTQPNPYLDQVFNRFNDLWGKYDTLSKEGYDPTQDIQNFQKMRAQGLKEVGSNLGARGIRGGGLSASQMQGYMDTTNRESQGIAASAHEKNLQLQKDLLTGMTSALTGQGNVGQASAQHQLGLLSANNDATRALFDNNYRMALLPSEIMRNNMSAMSQILALV